MNRAQARRQAWLDRFKPKDDRELTQGRNSWGEIVFVPCDEVAASARKRMAMVDEMSPEFRALLNEFPRLVQTHELYQWWRCGTPIVRVRQTLEERYGRIAQLPPLEPTPSGLARRALRESLRERQRTQATDTVTPILVDPLPPPRGGEAMSRMGVTVQNAADAVRDMCGVLK